MRVAYLAAGAGGMYCGSCMRDNRLAATLIAQGRDVVLIPLYTPLRTDEPDVSTGRVCFGGVNVFLEQFLPFFRRRLGPIDRILDARPLLNWAGRRAGATRADALGQLTVSILEGSEGAQRKEVERLIEALRRVQPSLVNLPNLMFLGAARPIAAALGVPVLCTLSGEDVFLDQLPAPHRARAFELIRRKAGDVDGFVAVTRYFAARAVDHFGLPADRVHTVPMGIRVEDFAPREPPPGRPFTIGYLARICPEKGLAGLCEAFVSLRREDRPCRLRVAGYLGAADRAYYTEAVDCLRAGGVFEDVDLVGELAHADKLAFLHSLHVLSVPAVYPEAKGFYVLEAMASGVPVVQPRQGSFPELVDAAGAGLLYDPSEPEGLRRALAQLMDDSERRARLGEAGLDAVRTAFNAEQMAQKTWALYQQFAA